MTLPNEPIDDLPAEIIWRVALSEALRAMCALNQNDREMIFDWFIVPKNARARKARRNQVIRHIWSKTEPTWTNKARSDLIAETYNTYRFSARWLSNKRNPLPPNDQNDLERHYHQLTRFNDAKSLKWRSILVAVGH